MLGNFPRIVVNLSKIVFIPLFNTLHPHRNNYLEFCGNYAIALIVSAEYLDALRA